MSSWPQPPGTPFDVDTPIARWLWLEAHEKKGGKIDPEEARSLVLTLSCYVSSLLIEEQEVALKLISAKLSAPAPPGRVAKKVPMRDPYRKTVVVGSV